MRGTMKRRMVILAAATAGVMLGTRSAHATKTWTGDTSATNLWADGSNWLGGVAPVSGVDDLIFSTNNNTITSNNFPTTSVFKSITFDNTAGAFTLGGAAMHLGFMTTGVGITHAGDIVNNSANTQTISLGLTLDAAKHLFTTAGGAGGMNFSGSFTHAVGATAIFNTSGGAINFTGSTLTNQNSILGGWATIGANFAALDGSNNVVPFTNYTGANSIGGTGVLPNDATANVQLINTGNQVTGALPATTTKINSFLYSPSGGTETLTIGNGKTLVLGQHGGIYNATGSATLRNLTIGTNDGNRGTLTAGDGINPADITFSAIPLLPTASIAGVMTINSNITNNGSAAVSVVYQGGYFTNNGICTYTGGTYILSGRLSQPIQTSVGSSPIYIFPGGEINDNNNLTNDISIAGNGTPEGGGLGALRMFNAVKLTGTITLMDNASVDANGDVTGTVGLVGKITGPGGLTIGSPTATSNNGAGGVFLIGSLSGSGVANDYHGDTTITGSAAGATVASTMRISNAGDTNIMPHGTGFGNVVLNAQDGSRTATFDLNGSTQTINALTATATSSDNDVVTSSTGNAVLNMGDTDASFTYAGRFTTSGTGNLTVNKIGAGTVTLTNSNAALNSSKVNTNVSAGTLVIAAGVTHTANLSTSGTGTLDVTAFSGGGGFTLVGSQTFTANSSNAVLGSVNVGSGVLAGSGTGSVGSGSDVVTLPGGGSIHPGSSAADGSIGTLTVNALTSTGGDLRVDLVSPDTGGNVHDKVVVTNTADFSGGGTVTVAAAAAAGNYTILSATGSLVGSPTLSSTSLGRSTFGLSTVGKTLVLNVAGGAGNMVWTNVPGGGDGTTWDVQTTQNWNGTVAAGSQFQFYQGDNVTFNDSNNGQYTVNVATTVLPASILVSNSAGDYAFSGGNISGGATLTKNGSRTLTLGSDNSYSGGTVLNVGTLNIGSNAAIGTGTLTIAGGTTIGTPTGGITLSNNNPIVINGSFTEAGPNDLNAGNGAVTLNATSTITVSTGTLTFGGSVGSGVAGAGLTKAGAGTLVLNAVNSYNGPTVVSGGTLSIPLNTGISGSSSFTVQNGALVLFGNTFSGPNFGGGNIIGGPGGGTVKYVGQNLNGLSNDISIATGNSLTIDLSSSANAVFNDLANLNGSGSLTIESTGASQGSTWTLVNGGGSFNGTITLGTNGGPNPVRFQAQQQGTLSNATVVVNAGSQMFFNAGNPTTNANFNIAGIGSSVDAAPLGAIRFANGGAVSGNITLSSDASITVGTAAANAVTLNGRITGSAGALTFGSGTFTLNNTTGNADNYGPVTAGSAATIVGVIATRVGTVTVSNTNSLSPGGLQMAGGTLHLAGISPAVANLSSTAANGTIDSSSGASTLTFGSDGSDQTFSGVAANGAGTLGLTKVGSGTETFTGANTYTGNTTVGAGTLVVAATGSLAATTNLIANGTVHFSNPAGQTVGSLNGAGTVSLDSGVTLTVTGGGAFSGVIMDDPGAVTVGGTTPLTLSGANTYTGNTTVNPGATLNVTGSLASTNNVTANGPVNFGLTGSTAASTQLLASLTIGSTTTASVTLSHDASLPKTLHPTVLTFSDPATSRLDITNNILISTGTVAQAEALVSNLAPNVPTVITSDANLAMGYGDAGSGNYEIRATLLGDSDLDGRVNVADLANLAGNFGKTAGQIWISGDFDYNGNVNVADLADLAGNFGKSLGVGSDAGSASAAASPAAAAAVASGAAVPEPASFGVLGGFVSAALLLRRRRRDRRDV
jgi:autotransporter-associated beta strand protein